MAEVERLQGEFRDLQRQSHAVVAGGVAVGTLALTVADSISLNLALVLATVATGAAVGWYMNINAEAVAVGVARDHLIERINGRLPRSANGERSQYSDLVARAGANALGTTLMVSLMMAAYLGFLVLGVAMAFDPPSSLEDNTWMHEPWREVIQIAVSSLSLLAVGASFLENRLYKERVQDAIRADTHSRIADTSLATRRPPASFTKRLWEFIFHRDA